MGRTKLGQHFLVNANVAKKIISLLYPEAGNTIEIGPGKGILTRLLIEKLAGSPLVAVEYDQELADWWQAQDIPQLKIIQADILSIQLSQLPVHPPFILVGNIPYYISKDLINWIIGQHSLIARGLFMMQKEFVDKLFRGRGEKKMNAQGIVFDFLFQSQKLFDVNPGSFSPPPKVKSTVFSFKTKKKIADIKIDSFYAFVNNCFKKPRQTLANNICQFLDKSKVISFMKKKGIDLNTRPESLSSDRYWNLYQNLLSSHK